MPNRTITKKAVIVIFLAIVSDLVGSCRHSPVSNGQPPNFDRDSGYAEPRSNGKIESGEINESSGLAASRCQQDVFWTHNDSGDGPYIYALDRKGKQLGTWKLNGARNQDWEDIAASKDASGNCFLYVGDIGNGRKTEEQERQVYRIREPVVTGNTPDAKENAEETGRAELLTFRYPDGPQDSEAMAVHPVSGRIYVITKRRDAPAGVYAINPEFGSSVIATKVAEISVPAIPNGFLTGSDISPDGKRVVLCDYFAAYELVLPADSASFDDVWSQKPVPVELGERSQGEAVAYSADGMSLLATSEGSFKPLIEVRRKN